MRDFEQLQKPAKLVAIKMKATMEKGVHEEVIGEDNDLITSIVSTYSKFKEQIKPTEPPGVAMATMEDPRDVYCEITKQPNIPNEISVNWKLKNTREIAWNNKMQLIPIMSSPTVKAIFDSDICQLQGMKSGNLNLKLQIPAVFDQNNLIMMFKLRTNKKVFVGPTLVLHVKIVPAVEVSSFDDGQFQEELPKSGNESELLKKGLDVYSEPQLLNMGSILLDEGYGDFERCMSVIRVLRGDIVRAREILS